MIKKKKTSSFLIGLFLLLIVLPMTVYGEDQRVSTEGQIGFTGKWIGPVVDPSPPVGEQNRPNLSKPIGQLPKTGGNLPQTNSTENHWLFWLGCSLVTAVIGYEHYKRQNKKHN